MTAQLNPYLTFDGTAREAMQFYSRVFGGELVMNTFGEYGAQDEPHADQIMHAKLETDRGFTLMASDSPPGMPVVHGSGIALSLSGDDAEDLRRYWAELAADGQVTVPLEKQVWGDEFGMCIDRFGIPWMVNISASQG